MLLTISHVTMKTYGSMVSAEGGLGLTPIGKYLLPDLVSVMCPKLQVRFHLAAVWFLIFLFLIFLFLDIFIFFLPPQEFERTAAVVALIRAVTLRLL